MPPACSVLRTSSEGVWSRVTNEGEPSGSRRQTWTSKAPSFPQTACTLASRSFRDGSRKAAAVSIGTKPTFEETPRVAEVHLLDWSGQLDDYEWRLDAELHRRLRGQYRYDDLSSFQAQIERDLADVRAIVGTQRIR